MFLGRTQISAFFVKNGNFLFAFLTATIVLLTAAQAQTACVRCSSPDTTYLCEIRQDEPLPEGRAGLHCASRIADEHGHQSCAVQRGAASSCEGVQVTYYGEDDFVSPPIAAQQTEPAADGKAEKDEPETLGEFADDTAEASSEAVKSAGESISNAAKDAGQATSDALKNAGNAIGDATKKTLKCLGSALNDC